MLATHDKAITEIKSFINRPLVPADNAAQYNSYLVFRFDKDKHKVGGFVETIIGDENNYEYKNHVKIEMVGVDEEFRGKKWCVPLLVYALKISINELEKKWGMVKKYPLTGYVKIVSKFPEAANKCYTQAFEEIGLKKTEEIELPAVQFNNKLQKWMKRLPIAQGLYFESKANYNPDWLNKDIPLPDEAYTQNRFRPPSQLIMGGRRRKTKRRKTRKRRRIGKNKKQLKRLKTQYRRFRIAKGDKRFKGTKGLVKWSRPSKAKRKGKRRSRRIYHRKRR